MTARRVLKLKPDADPSDKSSRVTLTLLGRRGCHLCDDAAAVVAILADDLRISLIRTDVDSEPALRAQFNEHVPVLLHGRYEICRHALDLPALDRYLASLPSSACREQICRT